MSCDKLRIVPVHNLAIRRNKLTELEITNGRCSSGSPVERLLLLHERYICRFNLWREVMETRTNIYPPQRDQLKIKTNKMQFPPITSTIFWGRDINSTVIDKFIYVITSFKICLCWCFLKGFADILVLLHDICDNNRMLMARRIPTVVSTQW